MTRPSTSPLLILGTLLLAALATPTGTAGQVCMPERTLSDLAGDATVYVNHGPAHPIWVTLSRDKVGEGFALLSTRTEGDSSNAPAIDSVGPDSTGFFGLTMPARSSLRIALSPGPSGDRPKSAIKYTLCLAPPPRE